MIASDFRISISGIPIGRAHPPQVVAEIGANHNGNPKLAAQLIEQIAQTGTRFVKFQLYTAAELVADPNRIAEFGPPGARSHQPVGKLFDRLSLDLSELNDLFAFARSVGLIPFATPFSKHGIDALVKIGSPAIKIASSDVNYLELLRHAASTHLPVILSLGKATLGEAEEAVSTLRDSGCHHPILLHCVAAYPAPPQDMNLLFLKTLQNIFPNCEIGFSDHSLGTTASIVAVALGASLIEKHVTLDRNLDGPDHWFSADIQELHNLVLSVSAAHQMLGSTSKFITPSEARGRALGIRSLCASRDIQAGEILQDSDLTELRPGGGLPPKMKSAVVGMRLTRPLHRGDCLTWQHFQMK